MSRIAYVDGRYLRHRAAAVHIEDRGYQFSDGVYEVCLVLGGRILDLGPHLDRLDRSLAALDIRQPVSRRVLEAIMHRVVGLNRIRSGTVYLQVTRGVARRDHAYPRPSPRPVLVVTCRTFDVVALMDRQDRGIAVATVPDLRWKRCDIKSVSLLGNVLAKETARRQGAAEAWMVDAEGLVTEGSSSTAWIVDRAGRLCTRSLGPDILPGITRAVILEIAREAGLPLLERAFTVAGAQAAREAFTASTTSFVSPVVSIDGRLVGDGTPGSLTRALIDRHWTYVAAETGFRVPRREEPH